MYTDGAGALEWEQEVRDLFPGDMGLLSYMEKVQCCVPCFHLAPSVGEAYGAVASLGSKLRGMLGVRGHRVTGSQGPQEGQMWLGVVR